jgi:AcrR family transcriptional regulator
MPKDNRERILNAARERMLKYGYRKTSIDEIAHDLTMSKNTIYRYFSSKAEIAEALLKRLKIEINHEMALIEESNTDPAEIISKHIFFLRQCLTPWFRVFMGDIKSESRELWKSFREFQNEKIANVFKLVEEGIKKKKFRKIDPALAVQMYMGAIDYVLDPEFLEKEKISFPDAMEGVLDIWQNGVLLKK